jgi:lipopolysaccharide transport system permease protein
MWGRHPVRDPVLDVRLTRHLPVSLVPEKWRLLYSLNPMVGVIEGFRWALLGKAAPDFRVLAISTVTVVALLFAGIVYFKRMERTFADVI